MEPTYDENALNKLLAALAPDEVPIDPMPSLTQSPAEAEDAEPSPETAAQPTSEGIWTRQPEETARAYACFCVYRDLGPDRTLVGAYRQETGKKPARQSSGYWNKWHRDHDWRRRAEAYDNHLDQLKREAEAQKWRERGAAFVERQFAAAEALLDKAEQMLKFPLVEKTVKQTDEKGNETAVTIEPAKWNMNSAARLIKVGIEIGRLASGLPTKHEKQTLLNVDVTKLTDEQLDRITQGEDVAAVLATSATTRHD